MQYVEQFVYWLNDPQVLIIGGILLFVGVVGAMMAEDGFSLGQTLTLVAISTVLAIVAIEILSFTTGDDSWLWQLWQSSHSS